MVIVDWNGRGVRRRKKMTGTREEKEEIYIYIYIYIYLIKMDMKNERMFGLRENGGKMV